MRCQFESKRDVLRQNLRDVFAQAEPCDTVAGLAWYPAARQIVREWATTYHHHDTTVACVIAALSPQCEWSRNLIIAEDILAGRPASIGALGENLRKARLIRDHADPLAYPTETMRAYFPGGPKVNNFARNLAGDDTAVTIDTHALQAALNDCTSTLTLKWTPYEIFADCYRDVAREVGLRPLTFQAIVWHVWKRLYPRMTKHALRKRW